MSIRFAKVAHFGLLVLLLIANATLTLAGEHSKVKSHSKHKKLSFGNLRKLYFEGGAGRYRLNSVDLPKAPGEPFYMSTQDQRVTVRVTFLESVLISMGEAVSSSKQALVNSWAKQIPVVAEILEKKDSIGSIKPVIYDLVTPQDRTDLKLQEELVFLWSADRTKRNDIGNTDLMPLSPFSGQVRGDTALIAPMPFDKQVIDVQYRGLKGGVSQLVGKIILQILYIRDHSKHFLLGGFVIVSRPNGDYEFYRVPDELLHRIIIEEK